MNISTRTWGGALLVLALVAVIVVAVTMTGGDSEAPPESAEPGSDVEQSADDRESAGSAGSPDRGADLLGRPVAAVALPGGEPLPQSDGVGGFPEGGSGPVAAPAGLELQRVATGTTLMVSTGDGPAGREGDVMTEYAQTAQGAALLAANYVGLGMAFGDPYADFLERFAGRLADEDPAAVEEVRLLGGADTRAEGLETSYLAPRWFKVSSCSPEFCTVEVAMPAPADAMGDIAPTDIDPNTHVLFRLSLQWAGEEWEILAMRDLPPVTDIDASWEQWI